LFATEFLARIEARFDQAINMPLSGAPRSQLASDLRVLFYEKYAIYYLPRPDEIIIVRVLHGSRDVAAITDESGFTI
jgi:toxin ParE1/3/4